MPEDDFALFTCLPREIQALIWDAAVRPTPGTRCVQRFIFVNSWINHSNPRHPFLGRFIGFARRGAIHKGYMLCSHSLTVPRDNPDGGSNDSVYELDGALWTACKDSRAAMERRFKKNEWWSYLDCSNHPERFGTHGTFFGQNGATQTASYVEQDGAVNHITMDPVQDLFHLDPRHLSSIDWWHHYAWDSLPLLDKRLGADPSPKSSFLGQNVGIDYDPSMLHRLLGQQLHDRRSDLKMPTSSLLDMIDVLHNNAKRTLWFVDYRLRPAEICSSIIDKRGLDREIFHSGNHAYVEVKKEDMFHRWSFEDNIVDPGRQSSIFAFFDELSSQRSGELVCQNSDRLRVLACQPNSGMRLQPRQPWSDICTGKASCPICKSQEPVRQRPLKKKTSNSSEEISAEDLNLFD